MSEPGKNQFATPSDCMQIIRNIEYSMLPRSSDRSLIDAQFNGNRPFSPQEEAEHQIQVNANFLEGYKIAQSGILQMNSALLYKDRFFNARCTRGKATKRREWSEKFTINLHRPLKRSRSGKRWLYLMQNRNCSLTLHGVGALWWANGFTWAPRFVPLDDLLIPTDAPLDMSDELGYFGINSWLTPYQLWELTQQEKSDEGWNKEMALSILKNLQDVKSYTPDYWDKPEKMESLWKQRSAYLNSDAVPRIKITTFYHQSPEGQWFRKVVLRENQSVGIEATYVDQFLYEGKLPFADSIDQIIHMQFGDGSVQAPFKYRSVRGLGAMLYSVVELMNRLRCQFTQSVFIDLLPLLRVDNPVDRDRPRMLQMQPYGVVDQGVSFITREERHQPNYQLVETAMSEFRQLMSENSASYVQDIDSGSGKEMTLGEAQIRLQSVNKMVASMLMGAYEQEVFLYEEIIRRFMSKTSDDPEVKEFQERCRADGIPDDLMTPEAWQVEITRAFGSGDQTLAQQEVTALMQIQNQLDPESQRTVRRQYIATMTRNPDLASELVPKEQAQVTPATKAADEVFPNLMMVVPTGIRSELERSEFVEALMQKTQAVVQRISQTDNVGTPAEVAGLENTIGYIEQNIQMLSEDPNEKQFVTESSKQLGVLNNLVKGFAQRQQEQANQANPDPETMAKIQQAQLLAQTKAENSAKAAEQKMAQKQAAFEQQLAQKQAQHEADMRAMLQMSQLDRIDKSLRTQSDIVAQQKRTDAEAAARANQPEVEMSK